MFIKLNQEITHGEKIFPAGTVIKINIENGYFDLEEIQVSRDYFELEFDDLLEYFD